MFEMHKLKKSIRVDKAWGWEEQIENNSVYGGKKLHLDFAHRSSMHYHKIKDETFYIESGYVLLELEGESGMKRLFMKPGESQRISTREKHRFSGIEDSVIMEFATHDSPEDSYRDPRMLSGKIPDEEFRELLGEAVKADNERRSLVEAVV